MSCIKGRCMHIDPSMCDTLKNYKEKRNSAMNKSRLIAFVVALAMVLSWVVVPESHTHVHAVETDPTLTVGDVEGKPGDTVLVPVTVTNNPGVTFLNLRVLFDTAAVDVVNSENNADGPFGSMTFMKSQKDGANPVTMYWESGIEDFTGNGIIGYVKVTIKEGAKPGSYQVKIQPNALEAFNTAYDEIGFQLSAGSVTVLCAAHDFGDYVSDNNATCGSDGTKTRTCKDCGAQETVIDAGSAKDHSFVVYTFNDDADCTTDGTETAKCVYCPVTDTRTAVGSALGHTFGEYVSDSNAGCETDGTQTAKCVRCDVTDTRTEDGSALGHNFGEYVSNGDATCATDGTETAECETCGVTDTRTEEGSHENAAHSFPTEYVSDGNATCTADGTMSRSCTICGEKETVTEPGSAKGHTFTAKTTNYPATEADCCHKATYYFSCVDCGEKGTETFEQGLFDVNNHVGGTEIRGAYAATEETTGYTGDTCCVGCGATLAKGEIIPVLDHTHNMVKTEAEEATCEAEGNTAYWTCTKCGKLYSDANGTQEITLADTVVPAKGHSWSEWNVTTQPTCENTGLNERTCACGKTETKVLLALGHDMSVFTGNGDATCEADGTETSKCSGCDKSETRTAVGSALGHDMGAFVGNGDATCTADGTETSKCSRCDKSETRTAVGSALGHSFTAKTDKYPATTADCCHKASYFVSCAACGEKGTEIFSMGEFDLNNHSGETEIRGAVAPTEEKEGYTGDTYCLGCGNVTAKGEKIPILDHTHAMVKTEANAATCEAAGNIAYWTCLKCEKTFADPEGANQVTLAETVTAALGHSFTNYIADGNATCEANGTETAKCDRCDKTDSRAASDSALGHAWTEWTVTTAPSCEKTGVETRSCSNCGKTETKTLEALGHDMGAYVSNGDATCTADGTETSKCSRCDKADTRTASGSALGHGWTEWTVTTAPTCETAGEETRSCGVCGKTETKALAALGHEMGAYISNGDAACEADGTETAKCSRCDKTETRNIANSALGHSWTEWTVTTAPACETAGEQTRSCGACGKTETEVLNALGHAWAETEVVTAPTCVEAGESVFTCGTCAKAENRVVEALGHDYESVVTAPTTSDKGFTTHTCTECADTYVDSYVDPIPEATEETKPSTPDEDEGEDDDVPETGDGSVVVLWAGMLLAAMMGTGALLLTRKKWIA